mmetsp:Transcript_36140/g.93248  ORF Transcript_36140/g.93248 Transcript_36140/m.93248 type:complete len:210 (+) Transcript_36140:804-1433(+)
MHSCLKELHILTRASARSTRMPSPSRPGSKSSQTMSWARCGWLGSFRTSSEQKKMSCSRPLSRKHLLANLATLGIDSSATTEYPWVSISCALMPASRAHLAATMEICPRPAPMCTMRRGMRSNFAVASLSSMIFSSALSMAFRKASVRWSSCMRRKSHLGQPVLRSLFGASGETTSKRTRALLYEARMTTSSPFATSTGAASHCVACRL